METTVVVGAFALSLATLHTIKPLHREYKMIASTHCDRLTRKSSVGIKGSVAVVHPTSHFGGLGFNRPFFEMRESFQKYCRHKHDLEAFSGNMNSYLSQ